MLDVTDNGGEAAFCLTCNSLAHLGGGQTVVVPDDADDGDVDFWEYVCCHILQSKWGPQYDQDRHHDECVRPLECQLNQGHRTNDLSLKVGQSVRELHRVCRPAKEIGVYPRLRR